MFEDIKSKVENLSELDSVSVAAIEALQKAHPDMPRDYLLFLQEIGSGSLGGMQLYSGPISAVSVYPFAVGTDLEKLLLIGDDFQGFCYGFDSAGGFRVVEVDPRGRIDRSLEPTFSQLVRRFIA